MSDGQAASGASGESDDVWDSLARYHVLHQAVGVLIHRHDLSVGQAYVHLLTLAASGGDGPLDLAQRIVDSTLDPPQAPDA